MSTPEKSRSIKWAAILLGVLVAVGAGLLWWLLTHGPPEPSRLVAARDLEAFTLLTAGDLDMRPRSPSSDTEIAALTGRYLLVAVKQHGEVPREMLISRQGKEWLDDAVAVAIPTSATTSLGGQLHVGDVIDLVTFAKGATQAKPFENLLVLSVAPNKETNIITLAIPRARRDEFALAVTGTELVLMRRIIIANHQSK